MLQAEDRIYRMTSKDNVLIKYLYLSNTVDKVLYKSVSDKINTINHVLRMDNSVIKDFVENLMEYLNKRS